jgi:hypothetical protein
LVRARHDVQLGAVPSATIIRLGAPGLRPQVVGTAEPDITKQRTWKTSNAIFGPRSGQPATFQVASNHSQGPGIRRWHPRTWAIEKTLQTRRNPPFPAVRQPLLQAHLRGKNFVFFQFLCTEGKLVWSLLQDVVFNEWKQFGHQAGYRHVGNPMPVLRTR